MTGFLNNSRTSPLIGCTLGFGSTFSAQLVARVGYDWVLIDMEHNPLSAQQAASLTHAVIAASAGKCHPLIRVPSSSMEWTKWALDCGADGIIVPMVQSRQDAENIVNNATYPPLGQRSFGPALAQFADIDPASTVMTYFTEKSKNIHVIPMIESVQGVQHAEEICSVPGVTAVFVGPVDLRLSMGLKGGDGDEDEYLEVLEKLVGICKRLRRPIGIFAASGEECRKRTLQGFDYLLCPGESALLVRGAKASLADCQNGVEASSKL